MKMGKIGLAIKIILASFVALMLLGFVIGLIDGGYHASLNTADAKLTEALGYFSAATDLMDQERFNAADARLDTAVTAISVAEVNLWDAMDKGAPKDETDQYEAVISYTKSWISVLRSTINVGRLSKEIEAKGCSNDRKQRMITELDKSLVNLDTLERNGLTITRKYPVVAAELEIAGDAGWIRSVRMDLQDTKKIYQQL
jgi:hypothetical protein